MSPLMNFIIEGVLPWVLLALSLAGLWSVFYTLPKVHSWWRPLYWGVVPAVVSVVGVSAALIVEKLSGAEWLPPGAVRSLLAVALLVFSVEVLAVTSVHRMEWRAEQGEQP